MTRDSFHCSHLEQVAYPKGTALSYVCRGVPSPEGRTIVFIFHSGYQFTHISGQVMESKSHNSHSLLFCNK